MERFREDLGDLTGLAESIKEIGLLHPIVKNSKGTLIAGARRLEACKIAGVEPTFTIVDPDNLVKAELHENTQRKDFTPKEIARISKYISETESRQGERSDFCTIRTEVEHPRNSVADYVGVGTVKLSEINKIFDSGDVELQKKVNNGDISVHGAYEKITTIEKKKKRADDIEQQKQTLIEKPTGKFDVLVIDPPWNYGRDYDPNGSRVANPYPEMNQDELLDIDIPANDNAVMWLWTTHKFIWDAKELLDHWGFDYKATLVWNKESMGMGHWLRMQSEFCLLAIKGNPIWDNTIYRDIINEKKREHSRKPVAFYEMVEDICYGSKLDFFSREQREGWSTFGNDTKKFI